MQDRRNLYFYHNKSTEMLAAAQPLYDLAEQYGFQMVQDYRKANIVVSLGDDGTFLQAVRKTNFREDCLYAGISTTGNLNMYCDFHSDDTEKMIAAASSENIEVRRYPALEVTLNGETSFYCLNECSIRSSVIKTFVIDVLIDDLHFETFRGDGMVISSPTGSTAYNKSINGAVVDPLLPCIQVSEMASLNNNTYRTLGSSFILSSDRRLTLKINQDLNSYPIIGADNEAMSIKHIDTIEVKLSDRKIKSVKLKDNSFWEKVKRTFL
ncbi:NAD kinase [Peribacillus deserti]|uniref:NAD kinase n=1 Tax=Peribacillus deserti TaxID=673318 RepID=A0A2N5M0I8_9BACI|nr:NAD kinase [Peribacillus deserti]PLT27825.1 NAD kinase [Peribacillus deserti]